MAIRPESSLGDTLHDLFDDGLPSVVVPFAQLALPKPYCTLLERTWGPEFTAIEPTAEAIAEGLLGHALWSDVHPALRAHLHRLGEAALSKHRVNLIDDPRVRGAFAVCVDEPRQPEALAHSDRVEKSLLTAESESERDILHAAADVCRAALAYAVMPRGDAWVPPALCALTHGQSDRAVIRQVADCVMHTSYRVPFVLSRRACVVEGA